MKLRCVQTDCCHLKDLLKDINKELSFEETRKAEGKGHRMVIEETDGESSDEEAEHIENKPSEPMTTTEAAAASVAAVETSTAQATGISKCRYSPYHRYSTNHTRTAALNAYR